jgi:hypothetical protein
LLFCWACTEINIPITANPTTAKTLRLRIVLPSFCEDLVVYAL